MAKHEVAACFGIGMSGFRFSDLQREVLQAELSTDAYPDYEQVAEVVGEDRKRVASWFRTQRKKLGIARQAAKKFTAAQVRVLRHEADEDDCPDAARIARIAQQLGETKKRIRKWFMHERKRRGTTDPLYRRSKSGSALGRIIRNKKSLARGSTAAVERLQGLAASVATDTVPEALKATFERVRAWSAE